MLCNMHLSSTTNVTYKYTTIYYTFPEFEIQSCIWIKPDRLNYFLRNCNITEGGEVMVWGGTEIRSRHLYEVVWSDWVLRVSLLALPCFLCFQEALCLLHVSKGMALLQRTPWEIFQITTYSDYDGKNILRFSALVLCENFYLWKHCIVILFCPSSTQNLGFGEQSLLSRWREAYVSFDISANHWAKIKLPRTV